MSQSCPTSIVNNTIINRTFNRYLPAFVEKGGSSTFLDEIKANESDRLNLIVKILKETPTLKSSRFEDLKAIDSITEITIKYFKNNLDTENIKINKKDLKELIKSAFYKEPEKEEKQEDTETSRHDETISGTVSENIDKSYKDQVSTLFGKTPAALTSIPNKFK